MSRRALPRTSHLDMQCREQATATFSQTNCAPIRFWTFCEVASRVRSRVVPPIPGEDGTKGRDVLDGRNVVAQEVNQTWK